MSLNVTQLEKNYFQGEKKISILQDLQIKVSQGEVIAILGQSGSGKSTLLALLAGLDIADRGQIYLNNFPVHEQKNEALTQWRAKNVGIVFQQYHLLPHLTAIENVLLPLEILEVKNRNEIAANLLKDLGLEHRLNHLPRQMSGGECQRVAIARALATSPSLLLADEPSGNLDSDTGSIVMNAFFNQVRKTKTTTILVTHNKELADQCDRKYLLEKGFLKEI
ncbi:MAG: ABC transporter ATP-binding protein [Oligoflexia bacterium]|nr:ABC transporter ATP-binding protein [Oligoflexia bacterium]